MQAIAINQLGKVFNLRFLFINRWFTILPTFFLGWHEQINDLIAKTHPVASYPLKLIKFFKISWTS
ncbi:hypothetical protein Nizo2814_1084 [Lactiplantibacillus plantarum]|nr:hypothetical protein Nizo2814_1084 [Lactiplantibacillus plantarum]